MDHAEPEHGELDRWYHGLSHAEQTALRDPAAEVHVTATASRTGSDQHNQQLSEERAENIGHWLRDIGVTGKINTTGLGEEPARDAGKPDGVEDAADRVARIEIQQHAEPGTHIGTEPTRPESSGADPMRLIMDNAPRPPGFTPEPPSAEAFTNALRQAVQIMENPEKAGQALEQMGKEYLRAIRESDQARRYAGEAAGYRDTLAGAASETVGSNRGSPPAAAEQMERLVHQEIGQDTASVREGITAGRQSALDMLHSMDRGWNGQGIRPSTVFLDQLRQHYDGNYGHGPDAKWAIREAIREHQLQIVPQHGYLVTRPGPR